MQACIQSPALPHWTLRSAESVLWASLPMTSARPQTAGCPTTHQICALAAAEAAGGQRCRLCARGEGRSQGAGAHPDCRAVPAGAVCGQGPGTGCPCAQLCHHRYPTVHTCLGLYPSPELPALGVQPEQLKGTAVDGCEADVQAVALQAVIKGGEGSQAPAFGLRTCVV